MSAAGSETWARPAASSAEISSSETVMPSRLASWFSAHCSTRPSATCLRSPMARSRAGSALGAISRYAAQKLFALMQVPCTSAAHWGPVSVFCALLAGRNWTMNTTAIAMTAAAPRTFWSLFTGEGAA